MWFSYSESNLIVPFGGSSSIGAVWVCAELLCIVSTVGQLQVPNNSERSVSYLCPAGVMRVISLDELEYGDRPFREEVGVLSLLLGHALKLVSRQLGVKMHHRRHEGEPAAAPEEAQKRRTWRGTINISRRRGTSSGCPNILGCCCRCGANTFLESKQKIK